MTELPIQGSESRTERAVCAQSLCPTLCNPWTVVQARRLQCVAISSCRRSPLLRDCNHRSCHICIAGRFFTTSTTWQVKVHESEQTLGGSEGQGSVVCLSSWGCKELDMKLRTKQQSFPSIILGILHILSHTTSQLPPMRSALLLSNNVTLITPRSSYVTGYVVVAQQSWD